MKIVFHECGAKPEEETIVIKIHTSAAIVGLLVLLAAGLAQAQEQTVGLFVNDSTAYDGYTLFAPLRYTTTYFIDNEGRLVNSWEGNYTPGHSVYFLENGRLLRTCKLNSNPTFNAGGAGGRVEEVDWDGTVVWEYEYSSSQHLQHHDVEMLPNGNVLMIAWEYKSSAEAIAAGRNPSLISQGELWPDHIIEVEPTGAASGDIVWEWHIWDHLVQDYDPGQENYGVVADHPELIDINFSIHQGPNQGQADWNHTNAIDYNEAFDQIVISVHGFGEIWVIDHSTTTAEAAGHTGGNSGQGGDLLYRWGNPQAYDAGDDGDRKFYCQHDAQWIETGSPGEGDILVFNNGQGRPEGDYSTVDEFVPPVDSSGNYALDPGPAYGPQEQTWIYMAEVPTDFYSSGISGAQRLPNGNTLICEGQSGTFFEVSPDTDIVWLYVNPVTGGGPLTQGETIPGGPQGQENNVFRANRYAPDFPGFSGHDLTPGEPIEFYIMPKPVDDLTINLLDDDIRLDWSAVTTDTSGSPLVVDLYLIYRDTASDFSSSYEPFDSAATNLYVDTSGVVGDATRQYYYLVRAVYIGKESESSSPVGEFDLSLQNYK